MSQYRYTNLSDYSRYIPEFRRKIAEHTACWENDWIRIDRDGVFTVKINYAWDGCSGPSWIVKQGDPMEFQIPMFKVKCLPGDCIRTTTRGSMFHDAIYQFLEDIADALDMSEAQVRKIADKLFREIIDEDGFWMVRPYYWGVRIFGGAWHKGRKWLKNLFGSGDDDG